MKRLVLALVALATPLAAKDSLGIFGDWGAFRDGSVPRCYAIAQPQEVAKDARYRPYAAVGTWPQRKVRNQVHFRLSGEMAKGAAVTLTVRGRSFTLSGGGGDAWARDMAMDAAIVANMRSGGMMTVTTRAANGKRIADSYRLAGAASAMDAATVACVTKRGS